MNCVSILGRLTKDPDIRITKDDAGFYVLFTLASARGKDKVSFIPCIAYGKTAETIGNYVKKGTKIYVQGYIDTYTKNEKSTLRIVVTEVGFAENKNKEGDV